ncbi:MAG: hypothetical protein AABO41_17775 [Acidobacteriota bacterium]
MKKMLFSALIIVLSAVQIAMAHDPRTASRDFSHTLTVEGAGKLTISYKALHWNEPVYLNTKKNEQLRQRLNAGLWKKIGKLDSEFDIVIGGTAVAKGSYDLGISFGANDDFGLLLRSGGKEITVPFKTSAGASEVAYLTFDLRPSSDTDSFVLEVRSGKFSCAAEVKVPYLAAHDHDAKPAEKKP